jgi:multiple sugar transport system substrate-binding protein
MPDDRSIVLRGMTWDHPRGYAPLAACSAAWFARTGVRITWARRSLQDFESFPVSELAARHDLIVIDHPHVGQVTRAGCLAPLGDAADCERLAGGSVGASVQSYFWAQRLWALPIDAAAQVQAWRPDRLSAPLADWASVLALAAEGAVLCPLRPPHNLMALFTLCGLAGCPGRVQDGDLLEPRAGQEAYAHLSELFARLDPACLTMDPIAVLERMAAADSPATCAPLIYGYVSYSRSGAHGIPIAFGDLAPLARGGPRCGSVLGGTGIAVSAHSPEREAAMAFARWVADAEAQRGPYLGAGGQPAHRAAWEDPLANRDSLDFFRNTRATLEGAWVRPRHPGYMPFQIAAAQRLNEALATRAPAAALIAAINRLHREISS